jgi:hypothetical protein
MLLMLALPPLLLALPPLLLLPLLMLPPLLLLPLPPLLLLPLLMLPLLLHPWMHRLVVVELPAVGAIDPPVQRDLVSAHGSKLLLIPRIGRYGKCIW